LSYFDNNIVYIIVNTADITQEMINNTKANFYSTQNTLQKSADGTKTIFTIVAPVSAVFNGYPWYNCKDIESIMATSEWTPAV